MTYASSQDLTKRFGENDLKTLTDRQGTLAINQDTIQKVLQDADTLINASLSHRYSTPLSPVPDIIRIIAADIAYSRLFTHNRPEIVETLLSEAIQRLQDIASGTSSLSNKNHLTIDSEPRLFARKTLSSF